MTIADELAKLEELRRTGALTEFEFTKAKTALLSGMSTASDAQVGERLSEQLDEVKHQNELAQIDREWEIESRQYLIPDRWGRRHVPTPGMGIAVAIFGGVFGAFWTVIAGGMMLAAPDIGPFAIIKFIFPLFGVVFIVAAVTSGIYAYSRARKYQEAFQAYQERRSRARAK